MRPRRAPAKKKAVRKSKVTVDPSRIAQAALARIETVLVRTGHPERLGAPATMRELAARASFAGRPLPPSYVAAMKTASAIGEPEVLLDAAGMAGAASSMGAPKAGERLLPFARGKAGALYCFDERTAREDGEAAVVEYNGGLVTTVAEHFGEWLDAVADAREEMLEQAAEIPKGLRELLHQLGFRFDDPIVGTLETGDVAAIEALLGAARARTVRGDTGRLFDATGKALLTLNLDEFAMSCTLRTGTVAFEAEDVFRWLRTFRDESFFGETFREPLHPDQVRDLRLAPREPPRIVRGVLEVAPLPAKKHFFCAASGASPQDFYLLARGAGNERSTSVVLRVQKGEARAIHSVEQPLHHVHVTDDGVVWGLSNYGSVLRFGPGKVDSFPLPRAAGSLTWWYGIGEVRGRVVVWGTGALLEWSGREFVPFKPDAHLERHEAVTALYASRDELSMLVCGEHVGAVARFDGREWLPIEEHQMLDGDLTDLDVWRGVPLVLSASGEAWRIEAGVPQRLPWDHGEPAFANEDGDPRPRRGVRGFDGGALIATDGGVLVVGASEPTFHSPRGATEPARLVRVGRETSAAGPGAGVGIVAVFGPHVWLWTGNAFQVLDMRAW